MMLFETGITVVDGVVEVAVAFVVAKGVLVGEMLGNAVLVGIGVEV
jgi:hypothetical protein